MAKEKLPGEAPTAPTVVKPVANAIALLRHLGATGAPATVTQLARVVSINTSTCFNILRTLVAEGVLVFNEEGKTYQIGLGAVQLAQQALNETGKADVLRPFVEDVARRHGITVTLWTCGATDRYLLVGAAETESPFRIHMQTGLKSPLFAGAVGRCFVTERGLSEPEIDALYPTLHWARPPGLGAFKSQVRDAAERGWGLDNAEFAKGVVNVGVVVPRTDGPARYGLVATIFQGQMTGDEIADVGKDLIALANEISGLD